MKLLQLYYTSCKQGRSSRTGFQVYAASEGLTEEEIVEIERFCSYIPPTNLPSQPTDEEIRNDFPISFSSFKLKSGRYGICQSVYAGKDYSGRFGNFFTHVLVLEEGAWPFAPILLYKSPYLRTSLTEAEAEINVKPASLPSLSLQEPNGTITPSLVQNFLQAQDRYQQLPKMLDGLIDLEGKRSSLIIAAEPNDIPYWIAAIQLSFPPKIVNDITFSTYAYDPDRENQVILGVLHEGTRFSFQNLKRRSNVHGFNFITNEFREPKNHYRYTERVIDAQLSIESLNTFADPFKLNLPTPALDQLLDLEALLTSDTLEPNQLKNAVQFAKTYASHEWLREHLNESLLDKLIELCHDLDIATAIAQFIINVGNDMKNPYYDELVSGFLLEKTMDFSNELTLQAVREFFTSQMKSMNHPEIIRKLFLQDEFLRKIQSMLWEVNQIEKDRFYLELAMLIICEEPIEWKKLTNEQQLFLTTLSGNVFGQSVIGEKDWQLFAKYPSFFAHVVVAKFEQCRATSEKEQLMNHFMTIVEKNDRVNSWRQICFDTLRETVNGKDLMEHQFIIQLKKSATLDEMSQVLLNASAAKSSILPELVTIYVEQLQQSKTNYLKSVAKLMKEKKVFSILNEYNQLLKILDCGQSHIEFSNSSIEHHIDEYEQFIAYYEEKGQKNSIYELAYTTFKGKERRKDFEQLEPILLFNVNDVGHHFSENMLSAYLTWRLPELVEGIYDDRKKGSPLIQALIHVHADKVLDVLMNKRYKIKVKYLDYLAGDLFVGCCKIGMDEQLYEQMKRYLLEYEYNYKKVDDLLKDERAVIKEWNEMHEEIQESKGGSFVRSIKKIFGSKR